MVPSRFETGRTVKCAYYRLNFVRQGRIAVRPRGFDIASRVIRDSNQCRFRHSFLNHSLNVSMKLLFFGLPGRRKSISVLSIGRISIQSGRQQTRPGLDRLACQTLAEHALNPAFTSHEDATQVRYGPKFSKTFQFITVP
jgi:hypothetical protein